MNTDGSFRYPDKGILNGRQEDDFKWLSTKRKDLRTLLTDCKNSCRSGRGLKLTWMRTAAHSFSFPLMRSHLGDSGRHLRGRDKLHGSRKKYHALKALGSSPLHFCPCGTFC